MAASSNHCERKRMLGWMIHVSYCGATCGHHLNSTCALDMVSTNTKLSQKETAPALNTSDHGGGATWQSSDAQVTMPTRNEQCNLKNMLIAIAAAQKVLPS